MKEELDSYFREIDKKLFTLSKKGRAACLKEHRGNVDAFLKEHPDAAFQDVEAFFGSAEGIAESFLHAERYPQAEKKLHMNSRCTHVLLAVIVAVGLVIALIAAASFADQWQFRHGYTKESPVLTSAPDHSDEAIAIY